MSPDRDYCFWGITYEELENGEAYYENEEAISTDELGLSKETLDQVENWFSFFLDNINDEFLFDSLVSEHNFEQLGLFLYEQVRLELKNKYYVIYSPYSSCLTGENCIIDNNL